MWERGIEWENDIEKVNEKKMKEENSLWVRKIHLIDLKIRLKKQTIWEKKRISSLDSNFSSCLFFSSSQLKNIDLYCLKW